MKLRCLIVDDMHPCIISMLEQAGQEVVYQPTLKTKEELIAVLPSYHGLIVRSKFFIDNTILQHAPQLKFIGRAGAGIDNLDVAAIEAKGIKIFNAPEGNRDAVAEHAVGMLLALFNKFSSADKEVRAGAWRREENRGTELKGKTVGLIGYGYMGKAFAQRLSGFGVKVIAYDKYLQQHGDQFAQAVSLEELQAQADVLSLHIPLTEETKFAFDLNFFQAFKKSIWLINTARGELLSLQTIVEALDSGKLIGAALDVLENEKLPTLTPTQLFYMEQLGKRDNVLLTPHVAGWTFESYENISRVLGEKIALASF